MYRIFDIIELYNYKHVLIQKMLAEKYYKLEKLLLKLYTVLTKFQRTKQVLII